MANYNDLNELFVDIANAIREKVKTEESIKLSNFAAMIRALPEANTDVPYQSQIAQYNFNKGDFSDTRRYWLLNDITKNYASKLVSKIEFVPNSSFEFVKNTSSDVTQGWPNDHSDLTVSANSGLEVTKPYTGIILDVSPSSPNFTVSFQILWKTGADEDTDNPAELLYIGPMSGSYNDTAYYRAYRSTENSSNRFVAQCGNQKVTNINSVFDGSSHIITLVFRDGYVISYLDGNIGIQSSSEGIIKTPNSGADLPLEFSTPEDIQIIVGGIVDNYVGNSIYIDSIQVFDEALNSGQVKLLVTGAKTSSSSIMDGPSI